MVPIQKLKLFVIKGCKIAYLSELLAVIVNSRVEVELRVQG